MKITKEIKIAIVAIAGIVVLFFGLNFLKGLKLFSTDTKYYISFSDIKGLSSSSPIYANGYRVGVVTGINYDFGKSDKIMVEIDVNPKMRIPKGSGAEIEKDLMGNLQVNLLLSPDPLEYLSPGDIISGDINSGALGQMKDMIPAVEKMLPKLDSIMSSLNTLLADPAISQTLHNAQTVSGNLTETTLQLNTLLSTLNSNVPGIMSRVNGVLDNTETMTASLSKIDVESTMARINTTLANVEDFTGRLNSGKGTLGLLVNDPTLYYNLNTTMQSADSLLVNLRQHPKRYVHFSVFGKKDK